MHINQLSADDLSELVTVFRMRDPASAEKLGKLIGSGDLDPTLCFIASEDGVVKGGAAVCKAHSEGVEIGAALLSTEDPAAAALMLTHAGSILRERGVPYLVAEGEQELFSEWKGSEWLVTLGFVPPRLNEEALRFFGICLIDNALPTNKPIRFPAAMELPVPECRFFGINRMTDEQEARAIVTTRERRRLGERIALIIFAVLFIFFGIYKQQLFAIPAVAITLFALWRNISLPKAIAAEWLEARRQRGKTRSDDAAFFGEDGFIAFYDRRGSAIKRYDSVRTVYVKPDFLFLQTGLASNSARGFYIQSESVGDEQEFLEFIALKNPLAAFKK